MPIVTLDNAGKLSVKEKTELIERLTIVVAEVTGKDKKSIYVKLNEIPRENFGVAGKSLN